MRKQSHLPPKRLQVRRRKLFVLPMEVQIVLLLGFAAALYALFTA